MATRATYPIFKALTQAGALAVGYKLYTYAAGTSTPLTTYKDSAATIQHTNPIILNAAGEAEVFLTASAKFTLTDADGAVQTGWPVDDIRPTAVTAAEVSYTPSGSLVATNVQSAIDELVVGFDSLITTAITNDIIGGNITKTGANELSMTACSCWDSTREVFLETTITKTIAAPTGSAWAANTLYPLYEVQLKAGSVKEFRAYATYAAVAADAAINAYRWIGEWLTNGAGALVEGWQTGAYFHRGKSSESIISANVTTGYATKDHSSQMTTSLVELIEYGANDASELDSRMLASVDGTNLAYLVGSTAADVTTTTESAFGYITIEKGALKPFNANMQFKTTAGTTNLLVQQIKWNRR